MNNLFYLFTVLKIIAKNKLLPKHKPKICNYPTWILLKIITYVLAPINSIKNNVNDTSISERLVNCLITLGPIYIKFGQTLSTRADLCGEEIANNLRLLQDNLPPFSTKEAISTIESSFAQKITELFSAFNPIAVASASIAQVHSAYLHNGEKVAVKILRPKIHERYGNDIKFFYFLARILPKIFTHLQRLKIKEVVDVFHRTMIIELNLKLEASAYSEMADNFANDEDVYIPKIYWNLTNAKVITIEWVEGVSIYDQQKLLALGLNPRLISQKFSVMFFNQAYRDGFFHADLHPGNILVGKDGKIILLDFGIMGRLARKDRVAIAEILFALLKRNYYRVAELHLEVGYIPADTDLYLFAQYCRSIAEPILGKMVQNISIGNLLLDLFKITEKFGMKTQPQLILLQKTIIMVEGVGRSLDPEINIWQLVEPWISKWANQNLTPEAKILHSFKKFLKNKGII